MVSKAELYQARKNLINANVPLVLTAELLFHIEWFAKDDYTGIKSGYNREDLEVAIIREIISIWKNNSFDANNIKNLLNDNGRGYDVENVLNRVRNFKQTGQGVPLDWYRTSDRGTMFLKWWTEDFEKWTNIFWTKDPAVVKTWYDKLIGAYVNNLKAKYPGGLEGDTLEKIKKDLDQLVKDNQDVFDKYKEANRLQKEAEKERDQLKQVKTQLETDKQQLTTDKEKLNENLPGLFDKDGKLDTNKLNEVKNLQNNQEKYTDKDLVVFKELGIEDDQEKKECVKECYRLLEIYKKQINGTYNIDRNFEIRFAHIKKDGNKVNYDEDKLGEGNNGRTRIEGLGNVITYLRLDRYDSESKFRPGMVWFTMAHELSHSFILALKTSGKIPAEKINISHSLNFWKYFLHNSRGFTTNKLIKENIKDKYWKEYFRLSLPSEFPREVWIEDELKIYWPEHFLQSIWDKFPQTKIDEVDPSTLTIQKDINVPAKKSDWVWKRLSSGLIELINEEFETGKYDKTNIDYIWTRMAVIREEEDGDILIRVFYRKESVLEKKINELIDTAIGEKEFLTLSERQKITNLIGMWFFSVCQNWENKEDIDKLVDENFKWISQSRSQLKEIFKEDWSAFMEKLKQQAELEVSANYDSQYQEAINAGNKLLEKVKEKTTETLIEVPSKRLN